MNSKEQSSTVKIDKPRDYIFPEIPGIVFTYYPSTTLVDDSILNKLQSLELDNYIALMSSAKENGLGIFPGIDPDNAKAEIVQAAGNAVFLEEPGLTGGSSRYIDWRRNPESEIPESEENEKQKRFRHDQALLNPAIIIARIARSVDDEIVGFAETADNISGEDEEKIKRKIKTRIKNYLKIGQIAVSPTYGDTDSSKDYIEKNEKQLLIAAGLARVALEGAGLNRRFLRNVSFYSNPEIDYPWYMGFLKNVGIGPSYMEDSAQPRVRSSVMNFLQKIGLYKKKIDEPYFSEVLPHPITVARGQAPARLVLRKTVKLIKNPKARKKILASSKKYSFENE